MTTTALGWRKREPPLPIAAALAEGAAAAKLAERLANAQRQESSGLRVYVDGDVLVAVGEPSELTWVEGVTWLGQDGPILSPTNLEPDVPSDLVAGAVQRSSNTDGIVVITSTLALVLGASTDAPTPDQLIAFASNARAAK